MKNQKGEQSLANVQEIEDLKLEGAKQFILDHFNPPGSGFAKIDITFCDGDAQFTELNDYVSCPYCCCTDGTSYYIFELLPDERLLYSIRDEFRDADDLLSRLCYVFILDYMTRKPLIAYKMSKAQLASVGLI